MSEPEFVKVATLAELPPGRVRAVRVQGEDLAIYNVGGCVYATRDRCTHENYPLSKGELRGGIIKCSLHQWQYDVATGRCQGNPTILVRCFEVRLDGQDILVRLVAVPPPALPTPPSRDDA